MVNAFGANDAIVGYCSKTESLGLVRHVFMATDNYHQRNELSSLVNGGSIQNVIIAEDTDYHGLILQNSCAVWNLMFRAGYITTAADAVEGNQLSFKVPNQEVTRHLIEQLKEWYQAENTQFNFTTIIEMVLGGNVAEFKTAFQTAFERTVSYHDFTNQSNEKVYHLFALGLFVGSLERQYHCIESNRNAGYGHFNLSIVPNGRFTDLAIIIEFKVATSENDLSQAARQALDQIVERKYNTDIPDWCMRVDHYGIAFHRKSCYIEQRRFMRSSPNPNQWELVSQHVCQ